MSGEGIFRDLLRFRGGYGNCQAISSILLEHFFLILCKVLQLEVKIDSIVIKKTLRIWLYAIWNKKI